MNEPNDIFTPAAQRGSDCPRLPLIGPLLDGELDPDARRELELHVAQCEACRLELAQLRALSGMLSGSAAQLPGLSQIGRERIVQAWRADVEHGLRRLAQVTSAVAAAILVASAMWVFTHQPAQAGTTDMFSLELVMRTDAPPEGEAQLAELILSDLSGGEVQ
jgi:anti-sigma factor RsiW